MEILNRYREALVEAMDSLVGGPPSPILFMCRYHLGLADIDGAPTREAAGKMLRPALCLAMCEAMGGDPRRCLPAALSLELVHRTSLIFDDIQDRSPQRNHRPTTWGVWGVDQAINAGLALSSYARLSLHGLVERGVSPGTFLEVQRLLEHTVIDLCKGQYLDLRYQQRSPDSIPSLGEYLEMVRLKTGALLGTACEVGAIVAGARGERMIARKFGEALGIAFQLQDDVLGVWGDPSVAGKQPSDLAEGKLTLPVVLALEQNAEHLWPLLASGLREPEAVERLKEAMAVAGVDGAARRLAREQAVEAIRFLEGLRLEGTWHEIFREISYFVVARAL